MLKAARNIKHDGEHYKAGDMLPEMPEAQALALMESGAALPVAKEGKGK